MAKRAVKWLPLLLKVVKHVRIQSKHESSDADGSGVPLKLWTSQRMVLEQICAGLDDGARIFYILKSRQLGVTTITLLILLFWLALHPGTIGTLVSDNDTNRDSLREVLSRYLESLSSFMGKSFSVEKNNKSLILFSNNSRLDFLVAGKTRTNWGESRAYTVGHLTEVASYGKVEGIDSFENTMAPENPNALYIYESTAHGPNHWKDMWDNARTDPFTKRCIFVGWWSHDLQIIKRTDRRWAHFGTLPPTPEENDNIQIVREQYGYEVTQEQLAWYRYRQTQSTSGAQDLDQNQPWYAEQAFVQSGISFFQTRLVAQARERITSAPPNVGVADGGYGFWAYVFQLGQEFWSSELQLIDGINISLPMDQIQLRVWEKPIDGAKYAIGCDPAVGRNDWKDNHSIEVFRCFADRMVQVAEYAEHNTETRQCAWVLAYLAGQYQDCLVNVDLAGGPGQVIMQEFVHLRERMRSELYAKKAEGFEDFLAAANWYLYRKPDSPGPGFMYGTKTSHDIKFRMMNMMRDSFVTNLLEIRSVPLLDEMLIVRQSGPDIGAAAQGRAKDDRTFATALANMTWIENMRSGLVAQGITYEGSMARDAGLVSPVADTMNRRVYSLLRRVQEEEDLPPPRTFFGQRGLA